MHQKNIAHRDLKLDNMLIDDDMNIKILDFGLSRQHKTNGLIDSVGTPFYMAPELHEKRVHNGSEVDVFALGVILFSIVAGKFPFKKATRSNNLYKLIWTGQISTFFEKHHATQLTDEFKDLIIRMLDFDGSKRPTIDEIRNHPWMMEQSLQIKVSVKKHLVKTKISPSTKSKPISKKVRIVRRIKQCRVIPVMTPISKTSLDLTRQKLKNLYFAKNQVSDTPNVDTLSATSTSTANSGESKE